MSEIPEGTNVADYAPIIISALALSISGISLGWNIFRDVVLKPRVKITVDKAYAYPTTGREGPYLSINVTNFGPGKVHMSMIYGKCDSFRHKILRQRKFFAVTYDYTNPLSSRLPNALEPGEAMNLFLPWNEETFLNAKPTHIGVSDTFGRKNWIPQKKFKKVFDEWQTEFCVSIEPPN